MWRNQMLHHRGRSQTQSHETSQIKFKLGELDDALKKAQSLLDNKPQNENYLYLKGRILEKLDKLDEAEV